jgi:hypothetical protein
VLDPFGKREAAKDAKTGRKKMKHHLGAFFAVFASLRFQRAVEQALSIKKR